LFTFITAKPPGRALLASASSPAPCTASSSVSMRLLPALGSRCESAPPVGLPVASTVTRVIPFVPRSTLS
jgi:hypothetical protein